MGRFVRLAGLLAVLALVGAACGESQKVGSEQLLDFDPQTDPQRLGGRTPAPTPGGTPTSLTVGDETPGPTAKVTPEPTPQTFDVSLVADSPFYEPGQAIAIRVGVTLRVTNDDRTPERSKGRSFTEKNGLFHSGLLKPGQTWTWVFEKPAAYEIIDEGLPFATARLEIVR